MDEPIDTSDTSAATEPAPVQPAEPAAPGPRRRITTPWIIGGAVLLLGAGIGVGIGLSGHTTSTTTPAAATVSPSAQPLDLAGSITVPFIGDDLLVPQAVDQTAQGSGSGVVAGDTCVTTGGFTDVSQGAAVTIGGPDGKTLAVTALSAGKVTGQGGSVASCMFDFSADVPAGLSEYTVTVSHRGTQVFTEEQVRSGDVELTLGAP